MSEENKDFDFSKAFSKLEEITNSLEDKELDLNEGIKKFEEGLGLAEKLKKRLNEAENRVKKIKEDFENLEEKNS